MTDTMLEAIAQSSPSGKVSRRAREVAQERLRQELFGDGLPFPTCPQQTEAECLRREAADLRELAARGMKPRAHRKRAAELEQQADLLEEGNMINRQGK